MERRIFSSSIIVCPVYYLMSKLFVDEAKAVAWNEAYSVRQSLFALYIIFRLFSDDTAAIL